MHNFSLWDWSSKNPPNVLLIQNLTSIRWNVRKSKRQGILLGLHAKVITNQDSTLCFKVGSLKLFCIIHFFFFIIHFSSKNAFGGVPNFKKLFIVCFVCLGFGVCLCVCVCVHFKLLSKVRNQWTSCSRLVDKINLPWQTEFVTLREQFPATL